MLLARPYAIRPRVMPAVPPGVLRASDSAESFADLGSGALRESSRFA
jgi:hypothetical protein